tara:strand:+ start:258 stop:752 length:495 start_codon:yes stop_codon:yes gene_type:complete
MAKYISCANGSLLNFCYTDDEKNWWQAINPEATFNTVSDTDMDNFVKSKCAVKANADNTVTFDTLFSDQPNNEDNKTDYKKSYIIDELTKIKNSAEAYVNEHSGTPSTFASGISSLNTIISSVQNDSAGITYNTTVDGEPAVTAHGWSEPLGDAGTLVPLWEVF